MDPEDEKLQRLLADPNVIVCDFGPIEEDPSLVRQRKIGKEDQSVPGWDSFP